MRRLDWPERMAEALRAAQSKSFGESYYCAAFAADVVLAMTDVDPLPMRHETVAEAYRYMRDTLGFASLEAALEALVGPRVLLSFARRGDVILRTDAEGNSAIGICCGQDSAFISDVGLAFWPTLEQVAAFRVQ